MRTFILILKGILLWITIISSILLILGIDSIYSNTTIFYWWFIGDIILCIISYNCMNDEEFYTLSGSKLFNKGIDI